MVKNNVHIIGIGDDGVEGLTATARSLIESAEVVMGSAQSIAAIGKSSAEKIEIGADLDAVVEDIQAHEDRRTVVLATGDPLFYGMARYLCDRAGKERFEIVPNVSSMQLAFARVKESWDDAYLANLTGQDLSRVVERIRTAETVGLFTTESSPPAVVAQALLDSRIDYFSAYVCENLGAPDERVTQGELSDLAKREFSPLNVMVLVRKPNIPDRPTSMAGRRLFGNPDELFLQSKPKRGLLTPAEVRCVALSELDIGSQSVVWDVGAGSGSVALEAAQIASDGEVYAIEMDLEDHQLISQNCERFEVRNLKPVLGRAPEVWQDLPNPDAVFVSGAGRQISNIVDLAFDRLRGGGRLVANVNSIENVTAIREVLHAKSVDAKIWMVNISRGVYQLERVRFEAMNPTFLIATLKETKHG